MSAAWWGVVASLGALFVIWIIGAFVGWFDKRPMPEAQIQQRLGEAHAQISQILAAANARMTRRAGYDDSFRLGPDRSRW
jgi:hypothetical protein